jgi:hypothetical protein
MPHWTILTSNIRPTAAAWATTEKVADALVAAGDNVTVARRGLYRRRRAARASIVAGPGRDPRRCLRLPSRRALDERLTGACRLLRPRCRSNVPSGFGLDAANILAPLVSSARVDTNDGCGLSRALFRVHGVPPADRPAIVERPMAKTPSAARRGYLSTTRGADICRPTCTAAANDLTTLPIPSAIRRTCPTSRTPRSSGQVERAAGRAISSPGDDADARGRLHADI